MAIALGRTVNNPAFLFFQIVHVVSLFFVMLGVARVTLGVVELAVDAGTTTTVLAAARAQPSLVGRAQLLATSLSVEGHRHQRGEHVDQLAISHIHEYGLTAVKGQSQPPQVLGDAIPVHTQRGARVPFLTKLNYCFHVPLASLFDSPIEVAVHSVARARRVAGLQDIPEGGERTAGGRDVMPAKMMTPADATPSTETQLDGSRWRFYLQHVCAALLCSFPLSVLLQRRKLVLDFVITIYVVYFVSTDLVLGRLLGGGVHWWLACAVGLTVMHSTTFFICRHRELQEVQLSSAGVASPAPPASPLAAVPMRKSNVCEEHDKFGEEMRAVSDGGDANPVVVDMSGVSGEDATRKHKSV